MIPISVGFSYRLDDLTSSESKVLRKDVLNTVINRIFLDVEKEILKKHGYENKLALFNERWNAAELKHEIGSEFEAEFESRLNNLKDNLYQLSHPYKEEKK